MSMPLAVAWLVVGVVLGAIAAAIVAWMLVAQAKDRARVLVQGELATAQERIRSQNELIERQNALVSELQQLRTDLELKLREDGSLRASAEEKAKQVADLQATLAEREGRLHRTADELSAVKTDKSSLETALKQERARLAENLALLNEAKQSLSDAFKALAGDVLKSSQTSFLELANQTLGKFQETARGDLEKRQQSIDELVKPVKESLEKVDKRIGEIERVRSGAYEALREQVGMLLANEKELREQTSKLVGALGSPTVRGRWGEIQLRRVVELAGMLERCDFAPQSRLETEDGWMRPDLVVNLPGGKYLVIDAKAPLGAYLEALECNDDETHKQKMRLHAQQIRTHMTALSRKSYWEQLDHSPEFVILFLPGEVFFSAALRHDPELIESGVDQRVIVASPTTLIALLRAVHYGWQQESVAQNASEIYALGKELYNRMAILGEHMTGLGKNLQDAVEAYNATVRSLETRVIPGARRFRELKAAPDRDIPELQPIEEMTRALSKPELLASVDGQAAPRVLPLRTADDSTSSLLPEADAGSGG